MNKRTASDLICPHQFYTCSPTLQLVLFYDVPPLTMVPQQVHLHGQLGKTSRMSFHLMAKRWSCCCDIFLPFFSFPENAWLGISFLLDINVPTAFVLQPHKWSKIFGLKNHLSLYTQWTLPFYFITQPVNNECHVVFWVGGVCPIIYLQVADIAAFCLTKFKHFYPIFVGLSFDINTKEYMPSKWVYCPVDSQLFFRCVDNLKFCDVSITGRILNCGS